MRSLSCGLAILFLLDATAERVHGDDVYITPRLLGVPYRPVDPVELKLTIEVIDPRPLPYHAVRLRKTLENRTGQTLGLFGGRLDPLELDVRIDWIRQPGHSEFERVFMWVKRPKLSAMADRLRTVYNFKRFTLAPHGKASVTYAYAGRWSGERRGESVGPLFPRPGRYALKVRYRESLEAEVDVDVATPKGDDLLVYEMLEKSYLLPFYMMSTEEVPDDDTYSRLRWIVRRYPRSSYVDYARFALARWLENEGHHDLAIADLEEIDLKKFAYAPHALARLLRLTVERSPEKASQVRATLEEDFGESVAWQQVWADSLTQQHWRELEIQAHTPIIAPGTRKIEPASTLLGAHWEVWSLSYSPDGEFLAGGVHRGDVTVWDSESQKVRQWLAGPSGRVTSVAFSPDGKILAAANNGGAVLFWETVDWTPSGTIRTEKDAPFSVAFSSDGVRLAIGTSTRGTALHSASKPWEELQLLQRNDVRDVAFSPNGELVAEAHMGKTAGLWETRAGAERGTLKGHFNGVFSVSFSPDGKILATGSLDTTAKLWDVATLRELGTLAGHTDHVWSVAFSPDGRLLATASSDGGVKLWNVAEKREIATLVGHKSDVMAVTFSPDGKQIATGSRDTTVKLWDVPDVTSAKQDE